MTLAEYIKMSDSELLALYDQRRRNADGETCGNDQEGMIASEQGVYGAVEAEGWDLVRNIDDRSDIDTLLVRDGDTLYIVSDVNGPWAIQLTFADGSDRLA